MTRQHRLWRPTLVRGAATTPHIVIGMRSLKPMRHQVPQPKTSEFCELLNIAHLHFRFARQAGERNAIG
jgi:hypothetical protein